MKWIFNITKWLTGALFIFSGMVKLNDPSGFAIKLNEYFDVFAEDLAQKQDSIQLNIQYENQTVFSQTFSLYASDKEKKVALKLSCDSSNGSQTDLRFGGLERNWQADSLLTLPQQIGLTLTLPNGKNIQKTFVPDSLQMSEQSIACEAVFDVSEWVKSPGFWNAIFKGMKSFSLQFSIFFCALEVILGIALLLGYQIKLTVLVTAALIAFFTFLTGYSAYYNKVTDCGCFGDFLKLEPWQSFKKDVVLSVLIVILIGAWKHNRPIFRTGIDHKIMAVLSLFTFGFGIYCYAYLPVWDFLPYKKGNDIKKIIEFVPPGARATDSIQIRFVMRKGDDSVFATTSEFIAWTEKGYEFVRQDQKIIVEGYKSPIHDFAIYDFQTGADLKEDILNDTGFQWIFIMPFLGETYTGNMSAVKEIAEWAKSRRMKVLGLTSASLEPTEEFLKKYGLDFPVYAADQKMLMTMARYNPTLYLLHGSTVIHKFSGRNLPSGKDLSPWIRP
jgi:uncharacterized membrane protein YphA (DoxX/SURF4 family)